ncbi:interleukin-15 receptor subunit alpha isoform X2 [Accipiter gentilis]|uniref:interleukin-15 receptor subunit alpha isoform X2 n=1 Tax=Astur gentilis TaxID=8957 RepID=UPI00210FFB58|nr:interleukin-15 receptor subunit alpha isoform X2 [Accipiter gentilis]
MARPLLPLLCGTVVLLLPWAATATAPARCSRPKDVANAHIDVGNNTLLNTRLRYTCNPGYKRKAGTSSLIQCILRDGSTEPDWTHTTLQCIRDPALPPQTPSPELLTVPHTEGTTQKGTTDASPTSNPSPAATSGMPGAAGRSPMPPATDGPSLEKSTLPEMPPRLQTSTPGEGMAPGSSLGTTPLPTAPTDHAAGRATCLGKDNLPTGLGSSGKGSFTFSMHFFFSFFPNPFLVRVSPSIPTFPSFAAKNLHFSLLFQSPSRPWPLPLVSRAKSLFWQAGAYFLYFLA